METSERITLYECETFRIELEYTPVYVIWHTAEVKDFNRAVFKKSMDVLRNVSTFLSLHYDYLYTAMDPARDDLARLAKHGGFIFLSHAEGLDVYRKPLKGD